MHYWTESAGQAVCTRTTVRGSKKRVNSFVKRSMKDESGQHIEADANALSTIPDLLRDGRRERGFNSLQVRNDGIAIM